MISLFSANVFTTAVLIEGTVNTEACIADQTLVENPNWWKADKLANYKWG